MNQDFKNNNIIFNDDIINYIFKLANIKCHVCNCKYNNNFYKKLGNFYYCSKICFQHI